MFTCKVMYHEISFHMKRDPVTFYDIDKVSLTQIISTSTDVPWKVLRGSVTLGVYKDSHLVS